MSELKPNRLKTAGLAAFSAFVLLAGLGGCASDEQKVEKYTRSGEKYLKEGDLGRANVQFQNALKIDEEHIPALMGMADLAERKQDFQTMFGVLQVIVRLQPDNVDAQVDLGKLYLVGGDEKAALEAAEKSLALAPENLNAIALKAAIQLKLGDKAGAVELARKVIAADPGNAEAVAVLATERALDKDNEGSLAIVDAGLAANDNQAVLHLMRLQLLSNLGRKDDLRAAHEYLIKKFPENVGYRQIYAQTLFRDKDLQGSRKQLEEVAKLSPGKIEPILDVVRIAHRIGGPAEARKAFEKFAAEQPDNLEIKFNYAAFLRQEKDYAGSEAILSAVQKTAKDKAVANRAINEIAVIRLVEGKKDEARKMIEGVLAEDPNDSDAKLRLASLKIDEGKFDEAVSDLRAVISDKPDSTAAKMLLATAFEKKGDLDYAASQMAEAVNAGGHEPQAVNIFAKLLIRKNEIPRAEQVLIESLSKHPQDLENLKLLAAVRLMQQNWRGAEETAKLIEGVNAEDLAVNRILGAAYTGMKDYAGAISALEEAEAEAPLAAQPLAMLVSAYIQDNRAAEAETMLRGMIEKDPKNYAARLLLAQTVQALNRPADVETELKAAIAVAPERNEAVEVLYRLYRATRRDADAGAVVEAAVRQAPANDGFKILQADYFIAMDRPNEAIAVYADVLSRRPKDLLAANNFASLTLETATDAAGKAKALEAARILENSENPYFLDTLGWAKFHNGDIDGAIAALEKAVSGAPTFGEARYHLGAALLVKGDADRARAELQQSIAVGGIAPFVEKAKALLAQN
jgi:tetratricopeptide (TPR) repeat protein